MDIQASLNLYLDWTRKIERLPEKPGWPNDLKNMVDARAALERDIIAEFNRLQGIERQYKEMLKNVTTVVRHITDDK